MAASLTFTVKDLGVSRRLVRMIRAASDTTKPIFRIALFVARRGKERLGGGNLSKSLNVRSAKNQGIVWSNLPYAAVQQRGHPGIRPKTVKHMAIPLIPRLRRSGIWPRDFPKGQLRFVMTKKGTKFLALTSGGSGALKTPGGKGRGSRRKLQVGRFAYLLIEGPVKIKAKHYLRVDRQVKRRARIELAKHFGLRRR